MFMIKSETNASGQEYRRVYIYADSNFVNSEKIIVFNLNKFEEIFDGVEWKVLDSAYKKHFHTITISNSTQVYTDGVTPKIELEVDIVVTALPDSSAYTDRDMGTTCLNTTDGKVYEVIENQTTDADGNTVFTYTWQEKTFATLDNSTTVTYQNTYYRYNPTTLMFEQATLVGMRDFFLSYTFEMIGGQTIQDPIYQVLANYIDQYLYTNYQDEILAALGAI